MIGRMRSGCLGKIYLVKSKASNRTVSSRLKLEEGLGYMSTSFALMANGLLMKLT